MSSRTMLAGMLMLALGSLQARTPHNEPIVPIPPPPVLDARKVQLGEQLFRDRRLSKNRNRSCADCHDLRAGGASPLARDAALDGTPLPLNTPTLFNAALSFRLSWRGEFRTLEAQLISSIQNEQVMGIELNQAVRNLEADEALVRQFRNVYGRGPDAQNLVDALAAFERTLLTPGGRFDRWLEGDSTILSAQERAGYALFKSLGCVSCHQGVNVGGNMFQRQGVFFPLVSGEPAVVRVPSLRNVAATPPYFHDGSAATLGDAVHRMGKAQLNVDLAESEIRSLVSFLGTLSGDYRGQGVSR